MLGALLQRLRRKLGRARFLGARPRDLGLVARLAPLRQRIDRDARHHRQGDQRGDRDDREPSQPATRHRPLPLELAPPAPVEDRLGEDVVEDLVPVAVGGVERAEDALAAQRPEHRLGLAPAEVRELREVRGAVRDLRPGRRDQVLEHAGRSVLILVVEYRQRPVEVIADDCAGAPELLEGRLAENARSALVLFVPHALHHELQVRRLDPIGVRTRGRLGEHVVDEAGLDRDAVVRLDELVPPLRRPENRRARGAAVEPVEPQLIPEHVSGFAP